MIDIKPHRRWLGFFFAALFLSLFGTSLLGLAQRKAEEKRLALHRENEKAQADLAQLRDDLATVEKMQSEIDQKTAQRYIAPVDRLRAMETLERRAAEALLSHFFSKISPEEKVVVDTVSAGKQNLARSQWNVTAEAPADTAAFVFLDSMRRTLPGRVTIKHLSIQRLHDLKAPLSNANVKLVANGEWLSNGASRNFSEEK